MSYSEPAVDASCERCLAKDVCTRYVTDGRAFLLNPVEVEIDASDRSARAIVGFCTKVGSYVAHDVAHLPEQTVHFMRAQGLPTVALSLNDMDKAPEAPRVISEALKALSKTNKSFI